MNKLPFHKAWFFWGVTFVLLVALVAINNFFYYKSLEISEKRNIEQIASIFAASFNSCMKSADDQAACRDQLKETIMKSSIRGRVQLFDVNGKALLSGNNESYKDNRSVVSLFHEIGDGRNMLKFEIHKSVSPPILISVYRSLTFSLTDILSQDFVGNSLPDYLKNVVIPRSMPALSYMFALLIIFWLIRLKTKALVSEREYAEKQILYLSESLEDFKSKAEAKTSELTAFQEKVQASSYEIVSLEEKLTNAQLVRADLVESATASQKKSEAYQQRQKDSDALIESLMLKKAETGRINSELISQVKRLEQERNEIKLAVLRMTTEIDQTLQVAEKNISTPEKLSTARKIADVLLRNPDVKQASGVPNINPSTHHGKNFVRNVAEALQRNKNLSRTYVSVTSCKYGSAKFGTAELIVDSMKDTYALCVYSQSDAGYGAQITLSATEYWEAVVQAKCMVAVLGPLKGFTLRLKAKN